MFADFVGNVPGQASEHAGPRAPAAAAYRAYMLWLTFPPMTLLFLDEPVGLILAYGVLGAFFMPFLAVTLLWLLNSYRTPGVAQQRLLQRAMFLCALAFAALAVNEARKAIAGS